MIGRVNLVCDHRIGEESTLCCSCQNCLAISRSQSIEELRFQARDIAAICDAGIGGLPQWKWA
jgi:hypothetical protein